MNRLFIKNYYAKEDIGKYKLVTLAEDGKAQLATDSTKPIIGASGDMESRSGRIDITHSGIVPVYASAALAAGILVTCDSAGKVKPTAAGDYAVGITISAAMAAGDIIEILLK